MSVFPPRPAGSFSFREILYGKSAGVARITINRPDRYNAYSTACLEELASALRDAAFDDCGRRRRPDRRRGPRLLHRRRRQGVRRDLRRPRRATTGSTWPSFAPTSTRSCRRGKPVDRAHQRHGGRRRQRDGARLRPRGHRRARLRRPGRECASARSRAAAPRSGCRSPWATSAPARCSSRTARSRRASPSSGGSSTGWRRRCAAGGGVRDERHRPRRSKRRRKGADGYAIDLSRLDAEVDGLAQELLRTFPECARYTKQQTNFWKDFSWALTVRPRPGLAGAPLHGLRALRGDERLCAQAARRLRRGAAARRRAGRLARNAVGRPRPGLQVLRSRGAAGVLPALRRLRARPRNDRAAARSPAGSRS